MVASRTLNERDREAIKAILAAIAGVKHGTVEVVVQDSKVIQVNTTEKMRLDRLTKREEL